MDHNNKNVILHVCRTPETGVWTLMRHLAVRQSENANFIVAMRIISDATWPRKYYRQLEELKIDTKVAYRPFLGCGTISFLSHFFVNPVNRWIKEIEEKYQPEWIIVHFHNAWLSGSYLPLKSEKSKLGIVCTFHGVQGESQIRERGKMYRFIHVKLAQRLLKYQARLVSVDYKNTEVAEFIFGIKKELFHVVTNGVSSAASPILTKREADVFTIGFLGTLNKDKGWHVVADAVSILIRKKKKVNFLIAGKGPETSNVMRWVKNHPENARFLGYMENPSEQLMPLLDVLALPSIREGMPMVIVEALSGGVPVIATAVGGIPEVISDGYNGFLVDRHPACIADKIEYLLDDKDAHLQMRRNALKSFQEHFSIEECSLAYEKIYRSMISMNEK